MENAAAEIIPRNGFRSYPICSAAELHYIRGRPIDLAWSNDGQ